MQGLTIGQTLPESLINATVCDRKEVSHRLGSLWENQITLLVFLRHFGCIGCSVHMADLAPRLDELHDLGLRTILIGNGAPNFVQGFVDRYAINEKKVTIVTDPSLKTYEAAALRRSWWATFGFWSLLDVIRALMAGHTQKTIEGDTLQQGGVILTDRQGKVAFFHGNESLAHHAQTVDVIDSVFKLLLSETPLYKT